MTDFNFCFKGNRTYVHGSDMFNSVNKYLRSNFGQAFSHVDFMSINHQTSNNLKGEILNADQHDPSRQYITICKFSLSGEKKVLCLYERGAAVKCRYEYDEESVVKNGQISLEQKTITLNNETSYSPIEVIIALNKKLVQNLFSAERGKWLFTKLLLKRALPTSSLGLYSLVFKQNLGSRLTSSSIGIADKNYGDIYFSLTKG